MDRLEAFRSIAAQASHGEITFSANINATLKVKQMLDDPDKCRCYGDAGRKRVEEIFSWTAIAQQTIRLYEQLVEERRASAGA